MEAQETANQVEHPVVVTHDFARQVVESLDTGDKGRARELTADLHAADLAELLDLLSHEQRHDLIPMIRGHIDPETLAYLSPGVLEEVMAELGTERCAEALAQMDTDDAVRIIEDLEASDQKELLDAIPIGYRSTLQEGLAYPDDSAGRLMRREMVTIPEFWTVGDVIDYLRTAENGPADFYAIFLVDPKFRLVGAVKLSRVMRSKRDLKVRDLMEEEQHPLPVSMDQEEVARIFRKYGVVEAPVVSPSGKLTGVITVDDVVHVIKEEDEEDLMRMGGLIEHDLHTMLAETVRLRFPWLFVNLLTAIAASVVIGLYEGTIAQLVTLAVLMPIVASMGGNAGTQTLTVTVRALATREITRTNAWRIIRKELLVGVINGLIFAVIVGATTYAVYHDGLLSAVFASAMLINFACAGFSGTVIPVVLQKLRIDPAIASAVFLTTVTDIVGFFAFLGLAAVVLL